MMRRNKRLYVLILGWLFLVSAPAYAAVQITAAEAIAACETQLAPNSYIPEGVPYQANAAAYESITHGVPVTKWFVTFTADQPDGPDFVYYLYMDPPGTVLSSSCGETAGDDMTILVKRLEWECEYGLYYFWPVEVKARFNEQINAPHGAQNGYGLPGDDQIQEAEAVQRARSSLAAKFGVSQSALDTLWQGLLFQAAAETPYWIVNYWTYDPDYEYLFRNTYAVVVDAQTGDALDSIAY